MNSLQCGIAYEKALFRLPDLVASLDRHDDRPVMVYLAVTGAGQAFRWQLEPVAYADLLTAHACERLPLDTLLAEAREAHPGGAAESLRFHPAGGETASVRFSDR